MTTTSNLILFWFYSGIFSLYDSFTLVIYILTSWTFYSSLFREEYEMKIMLFKI